MTPVTIRGRTYPSTACAAADLGVVPSTISVAKERGTLSTVGLSDRRFGRGRVKADKYDPKADAEYVLENILDRRNWTPDIRDMLQAHLEAVTRPASTAYNAKADAKFIMESIMRRDVPTTDLQEHLETVTRKGVK